MRRGEVWVANLNLTRGAEVGKIRPVIIVQADWLSDQSSPTILVIPLSSQARPDLEPLRVTLRARDRLKQDCQVVTEKVRALDRSRFGTGPLTLATEEEMMLIEQRLRAVLGML